MPKLPKRLAWLKESSPRSKKCYIACVIVSKSKSHSVYPSISAKMTFIRASFDKRLVASRARTLYLAFMACGTEVVVFETS